MENTYMSIANIVIILLSGSLAGILANHLIIGAVERRKRKLDDIGTQLEKLYAPLYCLIVQNESAFERFREIMQKGGEIYSSRQSPTEDVKPTIETANEHINKTVMSNNERIYELVNKNFHLLDDEDVELMESFLKDHNRLNVEVDERTKEIKLPLTVSINIKPVSYGRPELINRVKKRFFEKRQEYNTIRDKKMMGIF